MFSTASATPFGRPPQFAQAYRSMAAQTGVSAADPHQLIVMLYDGFFEALAEARGAMRKREIERKGRALTRAIMIIEEGLRAGLDQRAGGELAQNLDRLYGYVTTRLTQANLRNDETILDECQRLVQQLSEAWAAIAPAA
jgi:flagellar protein FliS